MKKEFKEIVFLPKEIEKEDAVFIADFENPEDVEPIAGALNTICFHHFTAKIKRTIFVFVGNTIVGAVKRRPEDDMYYIEFLTEEPVHYHAPHAYYSFKDLIRAHRTTYYKFYVEK